MSQKGVPLDPEGSLPPKVQTFYRVQVFDPFPSIKKKKKKITPSTKVGGLVSKN